MQTLNVFEKGLGYLESCLSYFNGSSAFFLLYVCGLLIVMVQGTKKERQLFLPTGIFLLLTIYNPVAPVVLDRIFDVNSEYYRFFWITPVVVLVSYLMTKCIMTVKKKEQRIAVVVLMTLLILTSGNFLYANGYPKAENMLKMPEELLEVSRLIHEDAKEEYPKAFLEYEYNMQMRQFDPKMILTVDREEYINAVIYPVTQEMIEDEEHPAYPLLASLIRYQDVDREVVLEALKKTNTRYVVLSNPNERIPLLMELGLKKVAATEHLQIFRFDNPDYQPFELVDYSVVY